MLSSKLILSSWLLSYIEHLHPYPLFESVLNWCLKNNNEREEDFFFFKHVTGAAKAWFVSFCTFSGDELQQTTPLSLKKVAKSLHVQGSKSDNVFGGYCTLTNT